MVDKEDLPWLSFPEHTPSKPGKYLVEVGCGERTFTSLKLWRRQQEHNRYGGHGHVTVSSQSWLLGMEYSDAMIIRFVDIPL